MSNTHTQKNKSSINLWHLFFLILDTFNPFRTTNWHHRNHRRNVSKQVQVEKLDEVHYRSQNEEQSEFLKYPMAHAPTSLSRLLANSSTVMFFQMDTTRVFGFSSFKALGFTFTAF